MSDSTGVFAQDGARSDLDAAAEYFSRWPGILRLSLGLLLGPLVVLTSQELIYLSGVWVCGLHMSAVLHVIPILCLVMCIGAGVASYNDWRRVGGGVEEEHGSTVITRTRFLAIGGMGISGLSVLLTLAQWLAVFVFGPCMRA